MFFIVALVMITFVVLSPLGDLLGVQHFSFKMPYMSKLNKI
jgi:hypothetical protein